MGTEPLHGEHNRLDIYARYHRDIWMPDWIQGAAIGFLPPTGLQLIPSLHYRELADKGLRKLPQTVRMPERYDIIDVTTVRSTGVVYRVVVRFRWNKRADFCMVLEGDHEIVTGFWISLDDQHDTLDTMPYERQLAEITDALAVAERE